jgi:uncharacterized cupredoxin-like copper-binding protein
MKMATRRYLITGAVAAALTAGSMGAFASARGSASPGRAAMGSRMATSCTVPRLPGSRVSVMLGDMAGSASAGTMGSGRMMSGTSWMMLRAVPGRIAAGTVSIAVYNHGTRTHELVVLPLAAGATIGTRTVGADDTVSELGSLGEASNNCGAGAGEGLQAGSAGWITLSLKPGRYELICNLAGHYAAGMYTELDIT